MTQTALSEQMAKLNPNSGAQQLLTRVQQERQVAAAAAPQGTTLAQENDLRAAAIAAQQAEQSALEAEHGQLATFGTQLGRGVLDAVLGTGALLGAATEGAGAVTGLSGLENFGRDLGQASSGEAAMEAAAFLFGGGGKHGLTTAERVSRDVAEQQKAWPMLSTVAHTTGVIAPALIGGAASTGARGLALAGTAAFEGAGSGAQVAYEQNAPLRDVLSSALVGGALGAATAGAGEGIAGLVQSKALKAAARELVEDSNLKAAGVGRSDLTRMFGAEAGAAEAKASELAGEIANYRFTSGALEGKPLMRAFRTQEGIQEGIQAARAETGAALNAARQVATESAPEVAEAMATGAAKSVDDAIEQAMTARGADITEFQALRKQAQSFEELSELVTKAAQPEASALTTAIGAVTTMGSMLAGSPNLPSIAKGLLTAVGGKVVQQRSAATIATLANNIVTDTVANALSFVAPSVGLGAAGAAAKAGAGALPKGDRPKPLTPQERQDRYRDQLDTVTAAVTDPNPESRAEMIEKYGDLPAPLLIAASADMGQKMAQLHADMPKPVPNLRGKAYETLSSEQVRLANAMYEATVNPLSVFSDFAAGRVDYDKVKYAWKQYPALQQAAQAGLMDILSTQMTEPQRSRVSDGTLTQLDNLFGFEGALQPTNDRAFASRISQLGAQVRDQQKPQRPQGGGKLDTPGSSPTFTERIANGGR